MGMKCLGMTHAGCSLHPSVANWSLNEEESPKGSHRPLDLFSLVAPKKVKPTQKLDKGMAYHSLYSASVLLQVHPVSEWNLAVIFRGALDAKSTQLAASSSLCIFKPGNVHN